MSSPPSNPLTDLLTDKKYQGDSQPRRNEGQRYRKDSIKIISAELINSEKSIEKLDKGISFLLSNSGAGIDSPPHVPRLAEFYLAEQVDDHQQQRESQPDPDDRNEDRKKRIEQVLRVSDQPAHINREARESQQHFLPPPSPIFDLQARFARGDSAASSPQADHLKHAQHDGHHEAGRHSRCDGEENQRAVSDKYKFLKDDELIHRRNS
jgi:hypothetical protein